MKSFVKNWSYLVVSDIITKFIGFFATILLARNLNPDGYGAYNVILAISAIFTVVANFGMTQVLTREIARNVNISGLIFFRASIIRIFSIILSVLGIFIYFKIFENSYDEIYIVLTCILTISITAWDLFESVAFGRQVMKYSAIINVIGSFVWIITLFILPRELFTILNILIVFAFIDFFKAVAYYILIYRRGFLQKIDIEEVPNSKKIIMMSLPYLWLWGLGIFSNQVPILFLSQNSGTEEVGYFSVGLRLILPLTIVTNTAMKALFPNLSRLYKEDIEKFRKNISDGLITTFFVGSIIAFILTVFSDYYIPFLFGQKYVNSIMPFNFLIWFMVLYSVDVLLGTSLSASDKQVTLSILGTIDFIISLPILYLGSMHGAYYLALAKFGIYVLFLFYHWIIFKDILKNHFSLIKWFIISFFSLGLFYLSTIYNATLIFKMGLFIIILILALLHPKSYFRRSLLLIKNVI